MYVSIDMETLEFVHVHADHDLCSAIAWLEMPDRSVTIENTDREHFLCKFTALELRMLYRNTTTEDITGTDDLIVREMLATVVETQLKPVFADLSELQAQIAAVEDDLYAGIQWKYSLGSKLPAKQEELFPLSQHCRPLDVITTQQAAQRAPQRRKPRSAPKPRATPVNSPTPAPARKQRMFSVRPTIWAVADKMWQEAGSPNDKATVLELRKKMMAVLEEEKGIKRTSSSNELGNWMKERLT